MENGKQNNIRLSPILKGKFSGVVATKEAHYDYFAHGPLKRTELGNDNIQGTDYTYTIHGWLKAMNHPSLASADDPGNDGGTGSGFGKDVFGMALGYYNNDFKHTSSPFISSNSKIITSDTTIQHPLYNGNISSWTTNTKDVNKDAGLTGNIYRYDYLNRIKSADYTAFNGTNWTTGTTDYDETYSYDGNGNILTLNRNGYSTAATAMDALSYKYIPNTNKLDHVDDNTGYSANYGTDIDDQDTNNYAYDAIGNLTKDEVDNISKIVWTVYGKVDSVYKSNGDTLIFKYNASGQRISKEVRAASGIDKTFYSRDASGNVLSIYERSTQGDSVYIIKQTEIPIYGSDRISTYKDSLVVLTTDLNGDPVAFPCWCPQGTTVVSYYYTDIHLMAGEGAVYSRDLLKREYELKDHLGSVRALVYDRKDSTNNALLASYTNTYAFGMEMPGRQDSSYKARYNFNGQEKVEEIASGHQTAEFWEYDSRVGRRWNMDPKLTIGVSDYACFANNPIFFTDVKGDTIKGKDGKAITYTRNENKEIVWSKNVTDDVKELGNAMLTTPFGEKAFNKWQNAETDVKIILDRTTIPADNSYAGTQPQESDEINTDFGKTDNNGQYTSIVVTVYMKRIELSMTNPEDRFFNAAKEEILGAVGTHEVYHNEKKQINLDFLFKDKKELDQSTSKNLPLNAEVNFRKEYHENHKDLINKNWIDRYLKRGYKGLDDAGKPIK